METSSRVGPDTYRLRFGGTLAALVALLFMAGCASTPSSDGPAKDVDVGYGSLERDQITGSVSTVTGEDGDTGRQRSLVEMLSRVPGVRVSEGAYGAVTVRIRGSSSILSGEEPLFVVDGVKMLSGADVLRNINPNQIHSISVLKDAGQTAVYGSRGANGVILIRLKRGS